MLKLARVLAIAAASGVVLATPPLAAHAATYFWDFQTSNTTNPLKAVSFSDASNGMAVGDSGTIDQTSDGGTTWTPQTYPGMPNLRGVSFVNANNAWAVGMGATILHWNGTSWSAQTAPPGTPDLNAVRFVDPSHGWAVGDNLRIIAFDGTNWITQLSSTAVSPPRLLAVSFPAGDMSNGWAVGNAVGTTSTIEHTTNGTNWTSVTAANITTDLNGASFLDSTNGWLVDGLGSAWVTSNGSTTTPSWSAQSPGCGSPLYAVSFVDASKVWVTGSSGNICSRDPGSGFWAFDTTFGGTVLRGIAGVDLNHAWVAGDGGRIGVWRTTNPVVPESPLAILLPLAGLALLGGGVLRSTRRRAQTAH